MAGIKGYVTAFGYMGYMEGKYIPFPTETEYLEILADRKATVDLLDVRAADLLDTGKKLKIPIDKGKLIC